MAKILKRSRLKEIEPTTHGRVKDIEAYNNWKTQFLVEDS